MITRRAFCHVCLALVIGVPIAGCTAESEPKPPEIAYGHDVCDLCGMIISEPRFASALALTDGRTLKFDDPGEMFAYHRQNAEHAVRAWFVHDYRSEEWVRGEQAFYVFSPEIRSPMGYGIATFAERPAAEAFAHGIGGQPMMFEEARVASGPIGELCGPSASAP